jgi:hypothetical protein
LTRPRRAGRDPCPGALAAASKPIQEAQATCASRIQSQPHPEQERIGGGPDRRAPEGREGGCQSGPERRQKKRVVRGA